MYGRSSCYGLIPQWVSWWVPTECGLFLDYVAYGALCYFQIYVSKKWGFTKYEREKFETMKAEGKLMHDGSNVQYRPDHGPLTGWKKIQVELAQVA